MIHKAMTVQARNYHNLEHVLSLVDPYNPILTLAALFHDTIYYQVDQGFLPEIQEAIAPFLQQQDGTFALVGGQIAEDRMFRMAREAFNMPLGEVITPAQGLNEFLSAVVMNKKMGDFVPEKALMQMNFCIEATIPFRGKTPEGLAYFDALELRLREMNQSWCLEMTEAEIQRTICLAVTLANRDVDSFADSDAAGFLQNTWKLLPEMNVPLRSRNVYTIREYREALQRMEGFFRFVDPEKVFHRYNGVPTQASFEKMVLRARNNISVGQAYLRLKLLAQAILEALAEESGGDAPLSLFMGDVPKDSSVERLENYLPVIENPAWIDSVSAVYDLLAHGRRDETGFDLNISPLTLFIYRTLTPDEIDDYMPLAHAMFAGELSYRRFLQQLDPKVVAPIAQAAAKMVFTRSEDLLKYG